ncbi:MAG: GTP cyclohydrolase I [Acidobacteriota bacterium]
MADKPRRNSSFIEAAGAPDRQAMAVAVADFLRAAGLEQAAEGEAPAKCAAAWANELLAGYRQDPVAVLRIWPDQAGDLVTMRNIPFVSVCEHHLLPFYGVAHLAYLPAGHLTGLSRLTALVDCLARRLQIQERLTAQVAELLMQCLQPRGAACILEATHDCVGARSLKNRDSWVQTVAFRGAFEDDTDLQERLMRLVIGRGEPIIPCDSAQLTKGVDHE